MDPQEHKFRHNKYLRFFWKIWWIGLVILFVILAVQTYLVRFAH